MTFVLDATTRSLKMVLSDANGADVQFTATWADSTATGFTKGSSQGVSNGTSAVDVVAAPAASTRRVVKSITFHNSSVTDPNTVRFFYDDNGTQRTIAKFVLIQGESWYTDTASKEEKLTGVLDATNRTIKFVIDVAGSDVEFTAAWADSTATTFTQGSSRGASNGTSAVDIVAAPAANTRRVVKAISFYNAHASSTRTVTLYYDIAGTARTIAKFTLAAGESWFSDTPSFGIQPQGYVYAAPVSGSGPPSFRGLALSDVVSGTTGTGDAVLQTSPTIITPRIAAIHTTTTPFRAALSFVQATNSANYLQITNAATGTGTGPIIETIGTGSNVNMFLKTKGTSSVFAQTTSLQVQPLVSSNPGAILVLGGTGVGGGGLIHLQSNNQTYFTGFTAPDSLAADAIYVLPGSVGTNGQVLTTDGVGVLSWTTPSGGSLADGDKGDITVSASGATWTIDNAVVTLAKMADLATDRLIGRDSSGTGVPESLTVGGGIEFTGSGGIQTSAFTGDVTKTAGGTSTTIANDAVTTAKILNANVTLAKIENVASGSVFYRKTSGSGAPEVQTLATLKTDLGLTGTNSGDQTITLTGDVTGSGTGSFAATIANNAVTLAKMATMATDSILGRATASTGNVEVLTALPFAYTGDVTRPADSNTTTIANDAVTTAKIINDAVTYAKMQNVSATSQVLGRRSSGSGDVEECTLSQVLDFVGSTAQGDILYRGASTWTRLGAGTSGRLLQTKGTGANPEWAPAREVLTAARTYFVGFALGNCTITIASPAIITCTGSNLVAGDPVVFTTTGALPTNITAGTVYYVISDGLGANDFRIATTPGGSAINTTGTQSGTHSVHTGNDNNVGFGTNARNIALLTVQKAIDLAAALDSSIYDVTIQVCDGMHISSSTITAKTMVGAGSILLTGNTTNPANCILVHTSGSYLFLAEFVSTSYRLAGLNFRTNLASTFACVFATQSPVFVRLCHVTAGSGTFSNIFFADSGSYFRITGNLTLAATGSTTSFRAQDNGFLIVSDPAGSTVTVTISGTPSPGTDFLRATRTGVIQHGANDIYSGDFTVAPRKAASLNAVILGGLRSGTAFVNDPLTGGQIA